MGKMETVEFVHFSKEYETRLNLLNFLMSKSNLRLYRKRLQK